MEHDTEIELIELRTLNFSLHQLRDDLCAKGLFHAAGWLSEDIENLSEVIKAMEERR